MIVPRLTGGLGNQLFQIAAVAGYSFRHGINFAINPDLPFFCIQGNHPRTYLKNILSKIPTTDCKIFRYTYCEPHFGYAPIPVIDDRDGNIVIHGYFQSIKYWYDFKSNIKELFDTDYKCNSYDDGRETVGVHIRLGDYVENQSVRSIHQVCSMRYYLRAMSMFEKGKYRFLIFTDSPNYLRYQGALPFGKDCVLVERSTVFGSSVLGDFWLLSACDNIIMSNSSFSWWAAFLGKDKRKVYCPDRWFTINGPQDYQDIYVDGWLKMKAE